LYKAFVKRLIIQQIWIKSEGHYILAPLKDCRELVDKLPFALRTSDILDQLTYKAGTAGGYAL